jgi:hypothetical protein
MGIMMHGKKPVDFPDIAIDWNGLAIFSDVHNGRVFKNKVWNLIGNNRLYSIPSQKRDWS